MDSIAILKKEHIEISDILLRIKTIVYSGNIDFNNLNDLLENLNQLWDSHELREERLFEISKEGGRPFPNETMLIEEHKQLRGHWRILRKAVDLRNEQGMKVAFINDGEMLVKKFSMHIGIEEDFFDILLAEEDEKLWNF